MKPQIQVYQYILEAFTFRSNILYVHDDLWSLKHLFNYLRFQPKCMNWESQVIFKSFRILQSKNNLEF